MNDEKLNTEKEYVCVRVQIVKVKKYPFILGYRDVILGNTILIPNTVKDAEVIFNRIKRMFHKEGVIVE